MYITKNAVYLHIPKTAGTWLEQVILPAVLEQHDTNLDYLPDNYTYCFAIVRDPWSWYVSLYRFCTIGAEIEMPLWPSSITRTIGRDVSFEDFVNILHYPPDNFKNELIYNNRAVFLKDFFIKNNDWPLKKRLKNTFRPIAREWINNNNNFYKHIINLYTQHATDIGNYNTLVKDLSNFLIKVGDMTSEIDNNLKTLPPINYTPPYNYRDYYTPKLKDLVYINNKDIITKYSFEY